MTKREMFETLLTLVNATDIDNKAELAEGIAHELDLLTRKATAPKKPTAVQTENIAIRAKIADILNDTPKTVTDILAELNNPTLTNQRVTHILTAMVADGQAVRDVVKRKAFYTTAEIDDPNQYLDREISV